MVFVVDGLSEAVLLEEIVRRMVVLGKGVGERRRSCLFRTERVKR